MFFRNPALNQLNAPKNNIIFPNKNIYLCVDLYALTCQEHVFSILKFCVFKIWFIFDKKIFFFVLPEQYCKTHIFTFKIELICVNIWLNNNNEWSWMQHWRCLKPCKGSDSAAETYLGWFSPLPVTFQRLYKLQQLPQVVSRPRWVWPVRGLGLRAFKLSVGWPIRAQECQHGHSLAGRRWGGTHVIQHRLWLKSQKEKTVSRKCVVLSYQVKHPEMTMIWTYSVAQHKFVLCNFLVDFFFHWP